MSKNIKRNTKALQTTYDNYKSRLHQTARDKIQNLINLYEDRKIAQFPTLSESERGSNDTKYLDEQPKNAVDWNKESIQDIEKEYGDLIHPK